MAPQTIAAADPFIIGLIIGFLIGFALAAMIWRRK